MYQESGQAIATAAISIINGKIQVDIASSSLLKLLGAQHRVGQIDERQNNHQNDDGIHRAPRDRSIQWISAQRSANPQVAIRNMVSVNIANSFSTSD